MHDTVFVALIAGCSGVIGAVITALVQTAMHRDDQDVRSSELLLHAQHELSKTMNDSQLLWAWNRQLVDHIWKENPPPPPPPPEGLFVHD
jgi:K+-sensing histidine kinase KdpD